MLKQGCFLQSTDYMPVAIATTHFTAPPGAELLSHEQCVILASILMHCWIHSDWCQIVTSLRYKHGQNENLISIIAL